MGECGTGRSEGRKIPGRYRAGHRSSHRGASQLKTVERLLPIHEAQVVTYLRLGHLAVGLLVNFNVIVLKTALRRLTPEHPNSFRSSDLPGAPGQA
jgi:hypothetical protein